MDIDLYINSVYFGFFPLDKIMEYRDEYYEKAREEARKLDWDEVILYAIYAYDSSTQGFVSADFMCIRMTFSRYVLLCSRISKNCRVFCLKNN